MACASVPDSNIRALVDDEEFLNSAKLAETEILEIAKQETKRDTVADNSSTDTTTEFQRLMRKISIENLIQIPNFSGSSRERFSECERELDHGFKGLGWSDEKK